MNQTKSSKSKLILGGGLFLIFIMITLQVKLFDVAPIGPNGSSVGFSSLNSAVFDFLGTNDLCYTASEILGIVTLLIPFIFAGVGVIQWIQRKHLTKIDRDLFVLCGAYVVTVIAYLVFEILTINYRPVLEEGALAASYPSSHTLLAFVILGTALRQIRARIMKPWLGIMLQVLAWTVLVMTITFRLLSGVHWLTDICAGIVLGASIVTLYDGFVLLVSKKA